MNQSKNKIISIILVFAIPPIGLYMVWKNKMITKALKILLTIIGIINIFVYLVSFTADAQQIEEVKEPVKIAKKVETQVQEDVKPPYIESVKESQYTKGEYTAIVKFESSFSDEGTLGMTFVRMCHTLKYLQKEYPDAKWLFVEVKNGQDLIMSANLKHGQVNLQNKNGNIELGKAVMKSANTNINRSLREEINGFLNNNYIPMM